ncbi:hypothetical protein SLEP1_g16599 [Rubroshorea leprosula]|uniref:Uncharacterized protein n=1 Tax=Rubroshorea leprosula TaxID=152421 RepID=A0AAV5IRE3_9ROSI|nr:hypothetical protein SLEP1_g16599 [Rubroshorea leprosula]
MLIHRYDTPFSLVFYLFYFSIYLFQMICGLLTSWFLEIVIMRMLEGFWRL